MSELQELLEAAAKHKKAAKRQSDPRDLHRGDYRIWRCDGGKWACESDFRYAEFRTAKKALDFVVEEKVNWCPA